jgi:hypothetical protein
MPTRPAARRRPITIAGAVCLLAAAPLLSSSRARDADVQDLVRAWAGPAAAPLSDKEWRRLSGGEPIAMILDAERRAELSAVGAIRIAGVTPDEFVARFRRIEQVERGSTVLQIAQFGETASLADVGGLTLEAEDVDRLADCRPGQCDLQLPARVIARARAAMPAAPARAAAANQLFREFLVDLVRTYRTTGDAALEPYADRDEPLSVRDAFAALDSGRRVLARRVPAIARDIAGYPRTRPAGSHEFFYWSKLRFGFKPTVRVNHVLLCPVQDHPGGLRYVIVSKQLYASHYFDAALEWRMVVADRDTGGTVLVYRSDVRSRTLDGFAASLFRGIVKSRAKGGLERYLRTVKTSMEAPTRTASSERSPGRE